MNRLRETKTYTTAKRISINDRIFHASNYVVFIMLTFAFAFPFYYIIINTISANNLVDLGRVLFWPKKIHFSNYTEIFKLSGLGLAAFISIARTAVGTLLSVLGASYLGYLFSKNEMQYHKFLYRLVIITMYFSAGLIPGYLNIKALGLLNTFWVYVIPGMFPVFNMILVKTYMEQIPPALEESAAIDGASILRRYFFIMLPMSIPILATISVFTAVDQWSAFMDTVLYISDSKLHTLQYILYRFFQQVSSIVSRIQAGEELIDIEKSITPSAVRLTITVIVTLPMMLVYPFMQKYFLKGIMIGAVKG